MRKFKLALLGLLILYPFSVQAAAPTRTYSYTAHTTIDPTQNNANENSLYSYLQSGVDTYSAGSITNDAVSSSAAIAYSKLNLIGNIVNADVNASAGIVGSKLNLASPGIIGSGTPAAGTFTTLTGTDATATNLTASSTLKLGSTHQGDILYDNGTSLVRLTPGTSGQYLKTQGASANPTWGSITAGNNFYTSSDTFVAPTGVSKVYLTMIGGGGGGAGANSTSASLGGGGGSGAYIINKPYSVTAGNSYTVTIGSGGNGGVGVANGSDGGTTTFDTYSVLGGSGGVNASSAANGGAGGVGGGNTGAVTVVGSANSNGSISGWNGFKADGGSQYGGTGGSSPFGTTTGTSGRNTTGQAGTANTGVGGGGCWDNGNQNRTGGAGGSGFILVQY